MQAIIVSLQYPSKGFGDSAEHVHRIIPVAYSPSQCRTCRRCYDAKVHVRCAAVICVQVCLRVSFPCAASAINLFSGALSVLAMQGRCCPWCVLAKPGQQSATDCFLVDSRRAARCAIERCYHQHICVCSAGACACVVF